MLKKKCGECGEEKPLDQFHKGNSKHRRYHLCKECHSETRRKKRVESPEYAAKVRQRGRKWSRENREKSNAYEKRWRAENHERYRAVARVYENEYWKRPENAARRREQQRRYRARIKNDPFKAAVLALRCRISCAFRDRGMSKKPGTDTQKILGADWDFLIEHLGFNTPGTSIDHIIPVSLARNVDELHALNHWTNLRRIGRKANARKMTKLPAPELLHPDLPPLARQVYERALKENSDSA